MEEEGEGEKEVGAGEVEESASPDKDESTARADGRLRGSHTRHGLMSGSKSREAELIRG